MRYRVLILVTILLRIGSASSPEDRHAADPPARPGDMMADSPVTFPVRGALPSRFPPDLRVERESVEEGYFLFGSPCRSRAQIRAIQAAMPPGRFSPPPNDWRGLERTRRRLREGGDLHVLALGDSIINDLMRSGWVALLQETYPRARIRATVYVRGGGGCQHFREADRIPRYVVPRRPDLVLIGGISQRDVNDIRAVIGQLRAGLPEVEILLCTGAFGTTDPRDPAALARARHSGTGAYGRALRALAGETDCAYLDLSAPWAAYVRSSGLHPHRFYRDAVHANAFGEQILARILMAFWQSDLEPAVAERLEAFQDWKFGLMMHWGIYSQWGCIESWPLVEADTWARPDDLPAWTERGRDFARFSRDYVALNRTFNPQAFNPARWAALAREAGTRYLVFTTKHHDGFCLFDTRQTDYRVTHPSCPFHTNPRADIARAVFAAFRAVGVHVGAYYSKSDWHHPDYWAPEWPHPTRNVNYDTAAHPERWQRFVDFTYAAIEELVSAYGPLDMLWLDGGQVRPPKQDIHMDRIAAMARRHQPGLILVDRRGGGRYENYRTPEQKVPKQAPPYIWETCMTMGRQWSYKPDDSYKSPHELIGLLVDIVAKGGNFLLNVGPDPNGRLPAPAVTRLRALGRWLAVNGEAIYGTRPVVPYKQGSVCFTRRGRRIYALVLGDEAEAQPPETVRLEVPWRPRTIRMLGSDIVLTPHAAEGVLSWDVPAALRRHPPCRHAWAFVLEP